MNGAGELDRKLHETFLAGSLWLREFDELSFPEQVFLAVQELDRALYRGGLQAYLFNSTGNTAFAAVHALHTIGAHQSARIMAAVMRMFPGSVPPRDQGERRELLAAIESEHGDALDSASDEYCRDPDRLTELLYHFVQRNAAEIAGAAALLLSSGDLGDGSGRVSDDRGSS